MNKKLLISGSLSFLLIFLMFSSCITFRAPEIPTLEFMEYALEKGPNQVLRKSDVEISLEVIRVSDFYSYPKLFSFRLEDLPPVYAEYADNITLKIEYKPGPMDRQWEFPFASPDRSVQLLFALCKVKNNTQRILKMSDARIYLIVEGVEPLPAIPSLDQLLEQADYFEEITNTARSKQKTASIGRILTFVKSPLPAGFFRSIVLYNARNFKLINDLAAEILPGFTYEGVLAFPVIPSFSPRAKISFFDVITKVDEAGNPIEKAQFDFDLQRQHIRMWYDKEANVWKVGTPPEISPKVK